MNQEEAVRALLASHLPLARTWRDLGPSRDLPSLPSNRVAPQPAPLPINPLPQPPTNGPDNGMLSVAPPVQEARNLGPPFTPAPFSGGVNSPDYDAYGRRAQLRSEATEAERARREMLNTPLPSVFRALLDPRGASLDEALHRRASKQLDATGYPFTWK